MKDGIVKSRHSRENGNPENSNYMKILDSCLRRNDKNLLFGLFTRTSRIEKDKNKRGTGDGADEFILRNF